MTSSSRKKERSCKEVANRLEVIYSNYSDTVRVKAAMKTTKKNRAI